MALPLMCVWVASVWLMFHSINSVLLILTRTIHARFHNIHLLHNNNISYHCWLGNAYLPLTTCLLACVTAKYWCFVIYKSLVVATYLIYYNYSIWNQINKNIHYWQISDMKSSLFHICSSTSSLLLWLPPKKGKCQRLALRGKVFLCND